MKIVLRDQQFSTKRLTHLYIVALSAIAICAIVGQVVIQSSLYQQSSDARKINFAGRQRFLSLKLTMAICGLVVPSDPLGRDFRVKEARETLKTFANEHHGLMYGDAALDLPGDNSETVMQLFNSVEWKFQAIQKAVTQMLTRIDQDRAQGVTTPTSVLTPYVSAVLVQEESFVATMDKTVSQYQHEAEERVLRLRIIEVVLCSLTLSVLFLEGYFVFHPAIRRLQKSLTALLRAEKQIVIQVEELEQKNTELELAFEEAMIAHRKVMPHARVIALGHYQVQGSQGNYYEVESHEINGIMFLACKCPMYRRNRICSHSLAAASLHSALVRQSYNVPHTGSISSSDGKREFGG